MAARSDSEMRYSAEGSAHAFRNSPGRVLITRWCIAGGRGIACFAETEIVACRLNDKAGLGFLWAVKRVNGYESANANSRAVSNLATFHFLWWSISTRVRMWPRKPNWTKATIYPLSRRCVIDTRKSIGTFTSGMH